MLEIIFKKLLYQLYNTLTNTDDNIKIEQINNKNIYEKLITIPSNNLIIYIFIILIVYWLINNLDVQLKHIFTLLFLVIFIYILIQKDYVEINQFLKDKDIKLQYINKIMYDNNNFYLCKATDNFNIEPEQQISYLYLNPVIVDFYYDIRNYSQYNIKSYVTSLFHTNNVIKINYNCNIGVINPYLELSNAMLELKQSLNSLSEMIHEIPTFNFEMCKLENVLNTLQQLLMSHIIDIQNICKKSNETNDLNNTSLPNDMIESINHIQPNDTTDKNYMANYNMY